MDPYVPTGHFSFRARPLIIVVFYGVQMEMERLMIQLF